MRSRPRPEKARDVSHQGHNGSLRSQHCDPLLPLWPLCDVLQIATGSLFEVVSQATVSRRQNLFDESAYKRSPDNCLTPRPQRLTTFTTLRSFVTIVDVV